MMGDKIAAKPRWRRSACRWCPAPTARSPTSTRPRRVADEIGYPVLIKAAAGGGGRGMKVARDADELEERLARRARRGARRVRQRRRLSGEISRPAAPHRTAGAGRRPRQRGAFRRARLQPAAPPPEAAGGGGLAGAHPPRSATRSAPPSPRRCAKLGYRNAGTLEFLYQDGAVRLHRDEHAAAGRASGHRDGLRHRPGARADPHRRRRAPLGYTQADITFSGHAIECRITAEDPETFMPTPGRVTAFHAPGGLGVRVDSALYAGYVVPPYYDSMIAKLIVHAPTREEAIARLRRASTSSPWSASRPRCRCISASLTTP